MLESRNDPESVIFHAVAGAAAAAVVMLLLVLDSNLEKQGLAGVVQEVFAAVQLGQ